jgi:protein-S-isoprenylcysteine O-methyltransferase Ste14
MGVFYLDVAQALWTAWVVYWAISAADVKATQRREPIGSRAMHFIPMILAAALMLLPPAPSADLLFYRFIPAGAVAHWGGCLLILLGLSFAVWARRHLGGNWSGRITVKEGHELIQSGPYSLVRHPIYTGLLLAILGTALVIGESRGLLAVVLMGISYWRKLRVEERWMAQAFGDKYRRYREHTSALVPYLL